MASERAGAEYENGNGRRVIKVISTSLRRPRSCPCTTRCCRRAPMCSPIPAIRAFDNDDDDDDEETKGGKAIKVDQNNKSNS